MTTFVESGSSEAVNEMLPFSFAAIIVLLPAAFVVDLFYRKQEPLKKDGAAAIIMVVHAVLFSLATTALLMSLLVVVLNAAISAGEFTQGHTILSWMFGVGFLLYGALLLRTVNPMRMRHLPLYFSLGMMAGAVVLVILAIVGPVMQASSTRTDRKIEDGIYAVSRSINDYTKENKELPDSLEDVTFDSSKAQEVVDDGLVEYSKKDADSDASDVVRSLRSTFATTYEYELCVEYAQEKESGSTYNRYQDDDISDARYQHPAGEVCYDVETTVSDYDYEY